MFKTFSFSTQLKVGDDGERLFSAYYECEKSTEDRSFDFFIHNHTKTVELKTDSYPMGKTENFFMEKYSDETSKKLGGPWRAAENVDYFVYLFLKDKTFFWFEPKSLCLFLDDYIKDQRPKRISNRNWLTIGYTVPRNLVSKFYLSVDIF
jgi:hypothetical protein